MGRPVLTGSILEVTGQAQANGGKMLNVWHYKWSGPAATIGDGDAIVALLAAAIQPAVGSSYLDRARLMTHESVTWINVRFQWIVPLRYSPTFNFQDAGVGALNAAPMPMNVAGVATLRGELAGAAGIGRKHFGGLDASQLNGPLMDPSFVTQAEQLLELMEDVVDTGAIALGSNLIPVIYHRDAYEQSEPWSQYEIQSSARVMRRRTLGVGE